MEEAILKEIKKLNDEVKNLVKQDSIESIKIETLDDFDEDILKHNLSSKDLKEILLNGLHLEDKHLYPSNPDKKHKGKNYYCICRRRRGIILVSYILISYLKKSDIITLFHISPLNYGSEEQRRYKEIIASLKDPSFEKT